MAEDLLSRYRVPVSPDAPAGDDLTYDEAYLRIREEIDRAGTVSAAVDHESALEGGSVGSGQAVDFAALAEAARGLLAGPTRDLQLGAYLTVALARDRGADGIAEGLEVLQALIEAFGTTVHPLKPLRRRNALQYVADRLKDWLIDRPFGGPDAESLERASAAATAIQAWTASEMGDDAPALSGLQKELEEALRRAKKGDKPAADAAAPATNGSGAVTPAATAAAPVAITSQADVRKAVLQAVAYLREQDATSPGPFRLVRALVWGGLKSAPPNEGGRTSIEAPDATTRAQFDQMTDPLARLKAAEAVLPARPFWLDLQRIAAQAAEQAGPTMAGVRDAIVGDSIALIERVPELPSLMFADGSPFADAATMGWIDGLDGGGESRSAAPAVADDQALQESLEVARGLVAAGDTPAAVRAVMEATGVQGGRDRFVRGLHVARLCQQAGRHDIAAGVLDGLEAEMSERGIERWEPALALDCLRLAHASWSSVEASLPAAEKGAASARVRELFAAMCRVDPGAALAAGGPADKKGRRG